eukprot:12911360-Prorocentrum_lima.AAC.1
MSILHMIRTWIDASERGPARLEYQADPLHSGNLFSSKPSSLRSTRHLVRDGDQAASFRLCAIGRITWRSPGPTSTR